MLKSVRYFPLVLLVSAACTKPAGAPAKAPPSPSVTAAQAEPDVKLVAEVTLAFRQHPGAWDSVLAAHQLTSAQFDSLKAGVAADSNKNAAFRLLMRSEARAARERGDSGR